APGGLRDGPLRALLAMGARVLPDRASELRARSGRRLLRLPARKGALRLRPARGRRFPHRLRADRREQPVDPEDRSRSRGAPALARPVCRVQPALRSRHPVRLEERRERRRHLHEPAAAGELVVVEGSAMSDLASVIDHTLLKPDATREDLIRLCAEAREHRFLTVCVREENVAFCARELEGSPTRAIAVVGFPSGAEPTFAKVAEARKASAAGAAEIDMVQNLGMLLAKEYAYVESDIRDVVRAVRPRPVKVILETGALTRDQKIIASAIAKVAGAAFV